MKCPHCKGELPPDKNCICQDPAPALLEAVREPSIVASAATIVAMSTDFIMGNITKGFFISLLKMYSDRLSGTRPALREAELVRVREEWSALIIMVIKTLEDDGRFELAETLKAAIKETK